MIHPTQTRRRFVLLYFSAPLTLKDPGKLHPLLVLCCSIPGTYVILSSPLTTCPMSSVILEINPSHKFAFFVSPPPPPKKKRAAVNNTFRAPAPPVNSSHAILAWANNVHPGSPAPMTPTSGVSLPRRASFISSPLVQAFRRSSLNRASSCRQSTSSTKSMIPSTSFPLFTDPSRTFATPNPVPVTPSPANTKVDLTVFGYASSFLDIPVSTPTTPEIYRPKPKSHTDNHRDIASTALPTASLPKSSAPRMIERLFGAKFKVTSQDHVKRTAYHSHPHAPDPAPGFPVEHLTAVGNSSGSVGVQKLELYAAVSPLTVKREDNMRQATEGRSLGSNIHVPGGVGAKPERKRTAVKTNSIDETEVTGDVGAVRRDELGGVWWDEPEEWEFAHLFPSTKVPLSAQYPDAEGWVTYNHLKEFEREDPSELSSPPTSKHTDLYHSCPLLVTDEDAAQLFRGRAIRCSSIAGSIVIPSPSVESSNILLAIPSRPKRGRHLKPGFLKDVIAVPPTPTPPSPHTQASYPPRSPAHAARFIINNSIKVGSVKRQRSRSRSVSRRKRKPAPPPLKIVPICSVNKLAVNIDPQEDDRKILLDVSFQLEPQVISSRWSKDTTTLGPSRSEGLDNRTDGFDLVGAPKRSRRLGRFFKTGERDF